MTGSRWDTIDPAMPDAVSDRMLFADQSAETIKRRLFDGDTYAFATVQRAIQAVCKCPQLSSQYRDWQMLSQFIDAYIISGAFRQLYLDEEQSADASFVGKATDRFWSSVQKCANTFQEAALTPIAMWSSPLLGLVGTIQQVSIRAQFASYMRRNF